MLKSLLFTTHDLVLLRQLQLHYTHCVLGRIDETNFDGGEGLQRWYFIDWILPRMSGIELCTRLRARPEFNGAHVTLVLDGDNEDDRRLALRCGADDYIVGPLTFEMLRERLLLYGVDTPISSRNRIIVSGELQVDFTAHCVRYRGKLVTMAPNEIQLLACFMVNANRSLLRKDIIDLMGKDSLSIDERTVDVWVGRLRRNLQKERVPFALRSVRGKGYVWDSFGA